ncbi:MAG: hypothetical protein Q7U54_13835 [Bacteroidales bacterium]|nr:hypothetical protein [Bacteroidales bacterium]
MPTNAIANAGLRVRCNIWNLYIHLCWQTAEQQFIPALAIASAVSGNSVAYTNLALLSAQVKDFQTAIYYMKKYLLLVPESEDARSCQDKIYEWEVQITK